jgi:hypothetical protein
VSVCLVQYMTSPKAATWRCPRVRAHQSRPDSPAIVTGRLSAPGVRPNGGARAGRYAAQRELLGFRATRQGRCSRRLRGRQRGPRGWARVPAVPRRGADADARPVHGPFRGGPSMARLCRASTPPPGAVGLASTDQGGAQVAAPLPIAALIASYAAVFSHASQKLLPAQQFVEFSAGFLSALPRQVSRKLHHPKIVMQQ